MDAFYQNIVNIIEALEISVVTSPFCKVKQEFDYAVNFFEEEKVDAIVTIHMAYSPSLESCDAFKNTYLPIIIFDTTQTEDFSPRQIPDEIMYCHGIHGVMDMCNLLKRNQKNFAICAGHYKDEEVIKKLYGYIKASSCANALKGSSVGSVGGSFYGMGDFFISDEELKNTFDVTVVHTKKLSAFTINFQTVTETGLSTMPFMEASRRAMSHGIGYAGEGDILTAALTGALLSCYAKTSFVEIFCPDWQHDTLFISHMGEMNYRVADGKLELFEKDFIYGSGVNPIVGTAAFMPGNAVFVNLFKSKNGFKLLLAEVEVQKETTNNFEGNIRGWLRPSVPVKNFLEQLSLAGATHHSVLVYDSSVEELSFFAKCIDVYPVVIA